MNKKSILLLTGFVALLILSGTAYYLYSKQENTPKKVSFNFEKPESIEKIIITDAYSTSFTLLKKDDTWTDLEGNCVNQEGVDNILETAEKIQFKAYLNEKSEKQFYQLMQTNNIKVEFFENGEWSKTWYIGPSAQDHNGQIMILDAPNMKEKKPVIMAIRGMYGIIQPRFFTDPKQWMCTNIFSYDVDEIEQVKVTFPAESYRNFSIDNVGNTFTVKSNDSLLAKVDTLNVFRYLQKFKKIHFEGANYTLNPRQIDSLKSSIPFCSLELKTKGQQHHLKMYRIKSLEPQENEFGQLVNMDLNRFWCELDNGDIVKCQYFVFNPIILGNVYFPIMDQQFPKM